MLRIKELRENIGLSQNRLAQALNYSQTSISAWERGETEPSIDYIKKIAMYFNVSTDYLLGVSDEWGALSRPNSIEITKKQQLLLSDTQDLTDFDIEYLRGVIHQMKQNKRQLKNS